MQKSGDGLKEFLNILPFSLRERLENQDVDKLIEVVIDYGRPAEARFLDKVERMNDLIISREDIEFVVKAVGEFGQDNRAGIERTLHRISCIRNRREEIIGLTCRVGRALEGTIGIIDDIVRSGKSILLLGKPGVGKTTKLREIARVLADEVSKRVVIVDTSNEIGGDGDVPHPGIGSARRMQVRRPVEQHQVMIEAVENHMPEVIVIDEISTEQEALAARTIAERGVQLIGTAHGQVLENLMMNPTLCELVGGIQAVTLSDEEAKRRGTQKTVLERKAPPTFDVVIELIDYHHLAVHHDVQKTVDAFLRGMAPRPQIRVITESGKLEMYDQGETAASEAPVREAEPRPLYSRTRDRRRPEEETLDTRQARGEVNTERSRPALQRPRETDASEDVIRIYPYGVARTRLERAIRETRAPAYVCNDIEQADAVMVMRSTYNNKPPKLRQLSSSVQLVVIRSNSYNQIKEGLEEVLQGTQEITEYSEEALQEVIAGMEQVQRSGKYVDLKPQDARVRKAQHKLALSHQFPSEIVGQEPHRRLRILPR